MAENQEVDWGKLTPAQMRERMIAQKADSLRRAEETGDEYWREHAARHDWIIATYDWILEGKEDETKS